MISALQSQDFGFDYHCFDKVKDDINKLRDNSDYFDKESA